MDLGFSGLFANWVTIPRKQPPPISQHLYPKHQTFPTQSPTIGTWGKQPPLISCHNYFLAWQLYSFPLSFNACNSLRASSPGHSGGRAGKGRRACTYVSGIWISASKKSMQNPDWQRWHQQWSHYPWHMFFNVCLHSHSFPLHADGGNLTAHLTGGHREIGGGIQIPEA